MVMQLNMGEGKTAVIIPMVAARLANGRQLARIIVLASLFNMNYASLAHCMGGALNKRVYVFPFSREMDDSLAHLRTFRSLLAECLHGAHVVLAVAEHALSLKLKSVHMCGDSAAGQQHAANAEQQQQQQQQQQQDIQQENNNKVVTQQRNAITSTSALLLDIEHFCRHNCRDILDESDEILSVKYQLVYSVGATCPLDAGRLRWQVAQDVLKLAAKHLRTLKRRYPDAIEHRPATTTTTANVATTHSSGVADTVAFPHIRLLSSEPLDELCRLVCVDFLRRALGTRMQTCVHEMRESELQLCVQFVLDSHVSESVSEAVLQAVGGGGGGGGAGGGGGPGGSDFMQVLYILRGLLTYQVNTL